MKLTEKVKSIKCPCKCKKKAKEDKEFFYVKEQEATLREVNQETSLGDAVNLADKRIRF